MPKWRQELWNYWLWSTEKRDNGVKPCTYSPSLLLWAAVKSWGLEATPLVNFSRMSPKQTRANLITDSRKPKNYNGTIILEIDIMKKSFLINLNICQTWPFHNFYGCFLCLLILKLSWQGCASSRKEVLFWFWQWQKMWILNWVGMSFSWCQSQN